MSRFSQGTIHGDNPTTSTKKASSNIPIMKELKYKIYVRNKD